MLQKTLIVYDIASDVFFRLKFGRYVPMPYLLSITFKMVLLDDRHLDICIYNYYDVGW